MNENVVYFAHGKESGPWGTKITALAQIAKAKGCHVESPDYAQTMDPDERVKKLISLKPSAKKHLILVGSSMGGYVSTVASERLKVSGLFLLAPAFYKIGYKAQDLKARAGLTVIVHGWNDEIIPVENSIRFAKEHKAELYILDSDHRLMSALPTIEKLFEIFLQRIFEKRGH